MSGCRSEAGLFQILGPATRNSCRQVECLFSEQWGRWRERSEAGGVLAATCRREWPACSRPAASSEASAGYEELVRCGRV